MSRIDIDIDKIITSPEAKRVLRMVTKDFYSNSETGLWMFEAIGEELDKIRGWSEGLTNEVNPQTCTWSIPIWEEMYGFESDESLSLDQRRQRVMAKIVGTKPINPEIIRRGVAALLGISRDNVEVDDSKSPYSFDVIVNLTSMPEEYAKIIPYIRDIKPSHLRFELFASVTPDPIESTLYAGGKYSFVHRHCLPAIQDNYDFTDILNAGGQINIITQIALPIPENYAEDVSQNVYTGGVFKYINRIPVPQVNV